jgi:hypothetical protein
MFGALDLKRRLCISGAHPGVWFNLLGSVLVCVLFFSLAFAPFLFFLVSLCHPRLGLLSLEHRRERCGQTPPPFHTPSTSCHGQTRRLCRINTLPDLTGTRQHVRCQKIYIPPGRLICMLCRSSSPGVRVVWTLVRGAGDGKGGALYLSIPSTLYRVSNHHTTPPTPPFAQQNHFCRRLVLDRGSCLLASHLTALPSFPGANAGFTVGDDVYSGRC